MGVGLFSYTISTLSLIFSENNNSIIEFKKKKSLFKKIIKEYEISEELILDGITDGYIIMCATYEP